MEDHPTMTRSSEQRVTQSYPKLILVRHAESVANTKGVFQGQTYDTDLSVLGRKQAKALAKRLKDIGIRKIVASPLKRTYQTAMEISRVTGCEIEVNELILETDHGDWEGKNKEEIRELYPLVFEIWRNRPGSASFPKGEAFVDTVGRVRLFLESFDLTDRTVIVSHDNIVRTIACFANSQDINALWHYRVFPASINVFELIRRRNNLSLKVVSMNDDKHLKGLHSDISTQAL